MTTKSVALGYDIKDAKDLLDIISNIIYQEDYLLHRLSKSSSEKDEIIGEINIHNKEYFLKSKKNSESEKAIKLNIIYSGNSNPNLRYEYMDDAFDVVRRQLPNYDYDKRYYYQSRLEEMHNSCTAFDDLFEAIEDSLREAVLIEGKTLFYEHCVTDKGKCDLELSINRLGDIALSAELHDGREFSVKEPLESIIGQMDKIMLDYVGELVKKRQKELAKPIEKAER